MRSLRDGNDSAASGRDCNGCRLWKMSGDAGDAFGLVVPVYLWECFVDGLKGNEEGADSLNDAHGCLEYCGDSGRSNQNYTPFETLVQLDVSIFETLDDSLVAFVVDLLPATLEDPIDLSFQVPPENYVEAAISLVDPDRVGSKAV